MSAAAFNAESAMIQMTLQQTANLKMISHFMEGKGISQELISSFLDIFRSLTKADNKKLQESIKNFEDKKSEFKSTSKLCSLFLKLVTAKKSEMNDVIEAISKESNDLSVDEGQKVLKLIVSRAQSIAKTLAKPMRSGNPINNYNAGLKKREIEFQNGATLDLDLEKEDNKNTVDMYNSQNTTLNINHICKGVTIENIENCKINLKKKVLSQFQVSKTRDTIITVGPEMKFILIENCHNLTLILEGENDFEINYTCTSGLKIVSKNQEIYPPNYTVGKISLDKFDEPKILAETFPEKHIF